MLSQGKEAGVGLDSETAETGKSAPSTGSLLASRSLAGSQTCDRGADPILPRFHVVSLLLTDGV